MCSKQIKQNTFDKKRGNKRQKKYDLFLNTNICTMLDHVSSWLSFSLSVVSIFCTRFSLLYFSSFVTSQLTPFRPSALSGVFDMHYHKILKISPGTYIFQRLFWGVYFWRGLYTEGKRYWASTSARLILGGKFATCICGFLLYLNNFSVSSRKISNAIPYPLFFSLSKHWYLHKQRRLALSTVNFNSNQGHK